MVFIIDELEFITHSVLQTSLPVRERRALGHLVPTRNALARSTTGTLQRYWADIQGPARPWAPEVNRRALTV